MPGDELRLAGVRALRPDPQIGGRRRRLAVRVVSAQQRHIEAPARKLEVIRIAAERCDLRFGSEDQAHVVVTLVLVEPVLTALIETDGFTSTAAAARACIALLARLLELRDEFLAGAVRAPVVEVARSRLDPVRHVL